MIKNLKDGENLSPLLEKETKPHFEISAIQSIKGLLCMLMGCFLLSISNLLVKLLFKSNSGINVLESMIVRGLFQVGINQIIMKCGTSSQSYFNLNRQQVIKLLWRFALGYTAQILQSYTFNYLPLGLVQVIYNLLPLFTVLFAYLILRETMELLEFCNILLSFSVVIIIVVLSTSTKEDHQTMQNVTQFLFVTCIVLNFISAMVGSLASVVIRQLKDVHFSIVAGFQGLNYMISSTILLIIIKCFFSQTVFAYNLHFQDYINLFFMGLTGAAAQLLYIKALFYEKAGRIQSLLFLNVVFGYITDVLFFNYDIQAFEIIGSGLIILSSLVIFLLKVYLYND